MAIPSNKTYHMSLPGWADHWPEDHPDPNLAGKPCKSIWHFRRGKTLNDDEAASELTYVMVEKVDEEAKAKALAAGETYTPQYDVEAKMSARKAMLHVMSRDRGGWEGPEFMVPLDFEDEAKEQLPDGSYPIHELAGQVPPCTPEWIGTQDSKLIDAVVKRLNQVYAGRSPEEVERFQDVALGVDAPGPAEGNEAGVEQEAQANGGEVPEASDSGHLADRQDDRLDA